MSSIMSVIVHTETELGIITCCESQFSSLGDTERGLSLRTLEEFTIGEACLWN